jgi:hypothetical protein
MIKVKKNIKDKKKNKKMNILLKSIKLPLTLNTAQHEKTNTSISFLF